MFSSKLQFLDELNDQNEVFERSNYTTPQKSSQKMTQNQKDLQSIYGNSQKPLNKSQHHSQYSNSQFKQESDQKSVKGSAYQQNDIFSQQINERRQEAINRFMVNYENDLYHILNIAHTATKQEIKQQFRKLSLLYHPDKQQQLRNTNSIEQISTENSNGIYNPNEQDFVKILNAYNILSNDNLRQIYDQQGYQAVQDAINVDS